MSLSMHWFLIIGKKNIKKSKQRYFVKFCTAMQIILLLQKNFFSSPIVDVSVDFCSSIFYFAKIHPSFTQKISWQLKPTEMHLISSKLLIRDFRFLTSYSHFRKIYKRSRRFSHNSLDDFISLKNHGWKIISISSVKLNFKIPNKK